MWPFLSFRKKKEKEPPTLTTRLFAALIDCTIVILVLMPIQQFILDFFYQVSPNTELSQIVDSATKDAKLPSQFINGLKSDPKLRLFIHEGKLKVLIATQILQLVFFYIYILFFWVKYQATPGKMIISAKIVDSHTHRKPTLTQYVIRSLSYIISALPLFLGFFMIAFNKKRKGLHDIISNTCVISTK